MSEASFVGRYRLEAELGHGSMGSVYRAHDPMLDRTVAVKTIRLDADQFGGDVQELVNRFQHEARSAARLKHPNIVTIFDYGEHEGVYFLVMECIEGQTLAARLANEGSLAPAEAASVTRQGCAALGAAHVAGVVHRDVKPGNLMVDGETGLVKVLDFGIAKLGVGDLTRTGTVIGTPSYMSPEQVMGRHLDGRSDLFSLGAVLYELLTGRKAFAGDNVATITYRILNEEPAALVDVPTSFGDGFAYVLTRALAKRPEDRFQTAAEFAEALDAYCIGGAAAPLVPRAAVHVSGPTPAAGTSSSGTPPFGSPHPGASPAGAPPGNASWPSGPAWTPEPAFSRPRRNRVRRLTTALVAAAVLLAGASWAWLSFGGIQRPAGAPTGAPTAGTGTAASGQAGSPAGAASGLVTANGAQAGGPSNAVAADTASSAPRWTLTVRAEPAEASITIDDSLSPASGEPLELAEGSHGIRAEAPGFLPLDTTISLAADVSLALALARRPPTTGRLQVSASVPGRVGVDGRDRGAAPLSGLRLRPGDHTVRFTPDAGEALAMERSVTVRIGETVRVGFELTDGLVTIAVREPRWATVYSGDQRLGDTPLIDYRLPARVHTLRLEREGYESTERMVRLAPGQRFEWMNVSLAPGGKP